jgi:hypothetical protein
MKLHQSPGRSSPRPGEPDHARPTWNTITATVFLIATMAVLSACTPSKDAPIRSPSYDYQNTQLTTSDGRVVGVDNKSPGEWAQGHGVGAPAPGWSFGDDGAPTYDPKKRVGGAIDVRYQVETGFDPRRPRQRLPPPPPTP